MTAVCNEKKPKGLQLNCMLAQEDKIKVITATLEDINPGKIQIDTMFSVY